MCRNLGEFFFACDFWVFFFYNNFPNPVHCGAAKTAMLNQGKGCIFLAAILVYAHLRSLWNYCSRLKSQICTTRKDTEVNDFTPETNLNNGAHLWIGSWEAQRHKQDCLSYQAVEFMWEIESSYLHCWLSYKIHRNAELCAVCFMQRV